MPNFYTNTVIVPLLSYFSFFFVSCSNPSTTTATNSEGCQRWGACSQLCSDEPGGNIQCGCVDGFKLTSNRTTCTPEDPNIQIIFSLQNSVQVISMGSPTATTMENSSRRLVNKHIGQFIGVTLDASRGLAYWTDVADGEETIYRLKLDGRGLEVVLDTGLALPEGVAFDWVAGNIYYTDSKLKHIGVCNPDGKACAILLAQESIMDKPRSIVLHPSTGKMFWTVSGYSPSIMAAGMDGSTPLPIVTESLKRPNGLAIDHGHSRLYWADAGIDVIETTDLDGKDRRTIRMGIRHPFSMDVFGDTIYWTDWFLRHIQSCNKFTVLHPAAQPRNIPNPCANTTCSHICVIRPTWSLKGYRCLCPKDMSLDVGGHQCVFERGCAIGHFSCGHDDKCISKEWRCDGREDCRDASDERDCSPCPLGYSKDADGCRFRCKEDQFKCRGVDRIPAGCIQASWVCDGEPDCFDGSDEHQHCLAECAAEEFRCVNRRCIRQSLVCNGRDDCEDNSDEVECPQEPSPVAPSIGDELLEVETTKDQMNGSTSMAARPWDKFRCLSGEFLSFNEVCNERPDCDDGSDEGVHCEKACNLGGHGCSHKCHRSPSGPICSCPAGYRLSEKDSKSCEDMDECVEERMCDHYCHNLIGSFKCSCHKEYILKFDNVTCKAKGGPPILVYASYSDIYVMTQDMEAKRWVKVLPGLSGVAVDSAHDQVYWTNEQNGVIGRSSLHGNSSELVIEGLQSPGVLAFDWISKNAIVVDSLPQVRGDGRRTLVMKLCSLNDNPKKRGCTIVYFLLGHKVTSMALTPAQSYVFWTSTFQNGLGSKSGALTRAAMDGTGAVKIVTDKIVNPTGLTIDHVFSRVFWLDTATRTVEAVNFDGTNRAVVISSGHFTKATNLAFFEGWLIWNEEGRYVRCHVDRPMECVREKFDSATEWRQFALFQKSLQPSGEDPCKNHTCSFICTGVANGSQSARSPDSSHICLCPGDGPRREETMDTPCEPGTPPKDSESDSLKNFDQNEPPVPNNINVAVSNHANDSAADLSSSTHVVIAVIVILVVMAAVGLGSLWCHNWYRRNERYYNLIRGFRRQSAPSPPNLDLENEQL